MKSSNGLQKTETNGDRAIRELVNLLIQMTSDDDIIAASAVLLYTCLYCTYNLSYLLMTKING